MKVLQTKKDLLRYHFDKRPRDTLLLISLDQRKQVFAQRLEYNADMGSFRSLVRERIKEGDNMRSTWMRWSEGGYLRKQLDLVPCRFGISASRLDDFESGMGVRP